MTLADCLFCKIAGRKIPSAVVYETESVLGFKDIRPQAPVHVLFIPKKHVAGLHEILGPDEGCVNELIQAARHMAQELGLAERGYRLVMNAGEDGGQTVDHLHLHLLGGRKMSWPPG